MSKAILSKYDQMFQPVKDDEAVMVFHKQITALPVERTKDYRVYDRLGGNCYIFSDSDYPDYVMEVVIGRSAEDSITSLYRANPIFNDRMAYINARKEMIMAIAAGFLAIPNSIAIPDAGRERDVMLSEHGTAQLVDQMRRMFP